MKSEIEKLLERAWGVKPLSSKNNFNYKRINQKKPNQSTANIIVKITGGAKEKKQARQNLDYDLQKNTRVIYNEDGKEITKDDVQDWLDNEFEENRKDTKATYRLVFSMSENIDKDILLKAVRNTIKELFPHNQKYFVLHENTNNNHVHVTIGKTSYDPKNYKRLNIDKSKLIDIKKKYQENLKLLGIKNARIKNVKNINKKKSNERSQRLELHNIHKVINIGFKNYKNDPTKKISPFIEIESLSKNYREIWDHQLFNQMKEQKILINDFIKIKKSEDGSLKIIKVEDPLNIKNNADNFFKFGKILSVEIRTKEKELKIKFESEAGIETITKTGSEARDLFNIKNELIGKNIRISYTENNKITILTDKIKPIKNNADRGIKM